MNIPKVVAVFETTITKKIDTSSTTCELDSADDGAGNAVSGLVGVTINEGLANEEHATGTISGTTLTFSVRGEDPQNPGTEITALKEEHDRGSSIKITNYPVLGIIRNILNADEGLPNPLKYDGAKAFADDREIPDVGFVNAASASAGGITAFMVTDDDTGLDISVGAGRWMKEGEVQTFAGAAGQAVTDDDTNFVQLRTSDGTLVINTSGFLDGHLPLAEVTTASGDITAIDDRRPWLSIADPNVSTAFTYGATLSANDPVYVDAGASNKLKKALATGASTADVVGICLDAGVDTDTDKRVALPGAIITGLSGLTASAPVYLTDAGGFSDSAGTYKKVVGWALTTTSMLFLPMLGPEDLAGGNAAASLANFNELMTLINATDATGAELETLTGGPASNADSLHTHDLQALDRSGSYVEIKLDEDTGLTDHGSGSAYTPNAHTSRLSTDATDAKIELNGQGTGFNDFDNDHVLDLWLKCNDSSDQNIFIGIGLDTGDASQTGTVRHIGFFIKEAVLTASTADGSTQDESSSIGGVTVTDWNRYRIEWTAATEAKFYVNGTLIATLNTNLPSGSTSHSLFCLAIEETTSNDRSVVFGTGVFIAVKP